MVDVVEDVLVRCAAGRRLAWDGVGKDRVSGAGEPSKGDGEGAMRFAVFSVLGTMSSSSLSGAGVTPACRPGEAGGVSSLFPR